jgi:hypothetical protein
MAKSTAGKVTQPSRLPRAGAMPALRSSAILDTRVLKKPGSSYCHCDWHTSHYVNNELY